jgi:hypothetical protein
MKIFLVFCDTIFQNKDKDKRIEFLINTFIL